MKENSVFDKFQEFWGGLDNREQRDLWNVMTALRGPDLPNTPNIEHIKMLTTARIRGLLIPRSLRGREHLGCCILDSLKDVSPPKGELLELFRNPMLSHFKSHLGLALESLEKRYPRKAMSIAKSADLVEQREGRDWIISWR